MKKSGSGSSADFWSSLSRDSEKESSSSAWVELDEVTISLNEPSLSKTDGFVTLDWALSEAIERQKRERTNKEKAHQSRVLQKLSSTYSVLQSWVVLACVGVTTGLVVSAVDVGTAWASDFKLGYCQHAFWIPVSRCCIASMSSLDCDDWLTWAKVFGIDVDGGLAWFVNFVVYITAALGWASTAAYLVSSIEPHAAGDGIPEAKTFNGGFGIVGHLSASTFVVKFVTIILAVASGLRIGKEGPFVHIAQCIASLFANLFSHFRGNEAQKRELYSAAASAGLSVAFGAPIGGVLFSFEEVSSYFPPRVLWRSFFCAISASITIQLMRASSLEKLVMYEMTFHHRWRWFELPFYMLIGGVGGALGAWLIRANVAICRYHRSSMLHHYPVSTVSAVAVLSGTINYISHYLRIDSARLLEHLFSDCDMVKADVFDGFCDFSTNLVSIVSSLTLIVVVSFVLTSITYGLKIPAGAFMPSMVMGGAMGRLVGILLASIQESYGDRGFFDECHDATRCVTPALYGIVGAAAVLSGVTRMTVSLVVIIFELTGGLEYVMPTMVAVIVAKFVSDAIAPLSLYDEHINLRGYPYLDVKRTAMVAGVAADVMVSSAELPLLCISDELSIEALQTFIDAHPADGYAVVTSSYENVLVGYISNSVLTAMLTQLVSSSSFVSSHVRCNFIPGAGAENVAGIDFTPWMDQSPIHVSTNTPIHFVIELFRALGLQYIIVLQKGKLVGIVRRLDLVTHLAFYQRLLDRQREHEQEMEQEMSNTRWLNSSEGVEGQHRRMGAMAADDDEWEY